MIEKKIVPTTLFDFNSFLIVYQETADKHLGIVRPEDQRIRLLGKWVGPLIGEKKMRDIRTEDVELVLSTARKNGCSIQAAEMLRRWMKQMFDLALIFGIVRSNPCEGIRCHSQRPEAPVFYSEKETERILRTMNYLSCSTLFMVMMVTGLNADICAGLTVDTMELESRKIWVSQRMAEEDGQSRLVYFTGEESEYAVHIPGTLAERLIREKRLQDRCKILRSGTWNNQERLWFTDSQGNALTKRQIQGEYGRLRKGSGVKDVCMRTIRSNYLVTSLREGGDFPSAIAQSGFVQVNSIMRYFLDVQQGISMEKARMFREYLKGS